MASLPKNIIELSDLLSSLPGIGPKLSSRLALYLAINGKKTAVNLQDSLRIVVNEMRQCQNCCNISTTEMCNICSDESRDASVVLVVEDPLDLYNIEAAGEYRGLYHVLNGVISPVNGIGPKDINVERLSERIRLNGIKEIIFGLNPNLEGDSTSSYIKQEAENINPDIKFTKLAKGIPVGSDIEFMSAQTLMDSVNSRTEF